MEGWEPAGWRVLEQQSPQQCPQGQVQVEVAAGLHKAGYLRGQWLSLRLWSCSMIAMVPPTTKLQRAC